MKKLAALLGVAILSLTMAGCVNSPIPGGTKEDGPPAREMTVPAVVEFNMPLKNGGSVTCIASKYANAGGLSCDWQGYHLDHDIEEGEN